MNRALDLAAKLEPSKSPDIQFLQWLAILHNPKSEPALVLETVAAIEKSEAIWNLASRDYPARAKELASAIGSLASRNSFGAEGLDAAIALLRHVGTKDEVRRDFPSIGRQMTRLWEKRIGVRVVEPRELAKEEFTELESDLSWEKATNGLIDTWRAERTLLFDKTKTNAHSRVPKDTLVPINYKLYRQYVLAVASAHREFPDWDAVMTGLDQVFEGTKEESGTEESGTEESGTEESGTEESGTEESGTEESGTDESGTDESAVLKCQGRLGTAAHYAVLAGAEMERGSRSGSLVLPHRWKLTARRPIPRALLHYCRTPNRMLIPRIKTVS